QGDRRYVHPGRGGNPKEPLPPAARAAGRVRAREQRPYLPAFGRLLHAHEGILRGQTRLGGHYRQSKTWWPTHFDAIGPKVGQGEMGLAETGARGRLIVALDMATLGEARALIERLGRAASFYKIGLELALSGGLDLARELSRAGKRVFLDMKLLDIANTVERATRRAADTGATFLTVHAQDAKTLSAAVAGRAGTGLKILGVTVLTNLDGDDLRQQGIGDPPHALVARRAALAREVGLDGVVSSGQEAERVRAIVGPDL